MPSTRLATTDSCSSGLMVSKTHPPSRGTAAATKTRRANRSPRAVAAPAGPPRRGSGRPGRCRPTACVLHHGLDARLDADCCEVDRGTCATAGQVDGEDRVFEQGGQALQHEAAKRPPCTRSTGRTIAPAALTRSCRRRGGRAPGKSARARSEVAPGARPPCVELAAQLGVDQFDEHRRLGVLQVGEAAEPAVGRLAVEAAAQARCLESGDLDGQVVRPVAEVVDPRRARQVVVGGRIRVLEQLQMMGSLEGERHPGVAWQEPALGAQRVRGVLGRATRGRRRCRRWPWPRRGRPPRCRCGRGRAGPGGSRPHPRSGHSAHARSLRSSCRHRRPSRCR